MSFVLVGFMRKGKGLSLVELLIVVSILSVLSAVAYPSYIQTTHKTYRTAAMADLLNLHLALEEDFNETGQYDFSIVEECTLCTADPERYQFSYQDNGEGYNAYVLTATPMNEQASDYCQILTVNKMAMTTSSQNDCW